MIRKVQTVTSPGRVGRAGVLALLLGATVVVAMPAAGTTYAGSPTGGSGSSMPGMGNMSGMGGEMDMQMTPITGTPTASDQAKVAAIVADTKAATTQYQQNLSLAVTNGYTHHTAFAPYAHFSNYLYAGLANQGVFDPTRPTSLLYVIQNGAPSLAGVMYTAPASDTPAQLAQLLPSTIVSWHQHFNMCYINGAVRVGQTQAACTAAGGTWAPKSQWMVHAWIYLPNPDGMFSIKNPAAPWPRQHR